MAERKYEDGAEVQHKSGGPKMIVVGFGQYGYGSTEGYKCRWFDEKHKPTEDTFIEAELKPWTGAVAIQRARPIR